MTGSTNGLVTRILNHCDPGIIQIWGGLHQLDLVMQCVFKPAFDGKFYSTLTSLIGYLWHQQNLISEMQSTCPKLLVQGGFPCIPPQNGLYNITCVSQNI